MAVILKRTLYFGVNPTVTQIDDSGSGGCTHVTFTAAQSHDANDGTAFKGSAAGDTVSKEGGGTWHNDAVMVAVPAAGAISYLRFKLRGKKATLGPGTSTAAWQARINGSNQGTSDALTAAYADYSEDFTTDPADGLAWTDAKIAAASLGFRLSAATTDATFSTTGEAYCSEFTVEVWGEGDITASPAGASVTADAAATAAFAGAMEPAVSQRDPSVVASMALRVDGGSGPLTVRSNTAPYKDQSNATRTLLSGVGPGSGTLDFNLGGLDATTSVDGFGVISGVKCFAIIRPGKDSGTLNNFRFTAAGADQVLSPQPTVNTLPVTSTQFVVVESPLITLGSGGQPFDFTVGAAGIFAQFAAWRFKCDWNVATPGHVAQCDVTEAWIEVHGPVGSAPSVIELTHALGLPLQVQKIESTL